MATTITKLQYKYLTMSNQDKKKFVEKVTSEAGISKRSFYDYIKGTTTPQKLVREKIAELIGLEAKELNKEHYTTVPAALS